MKKLSLAIAEDFYSVQIEKIKSLKGSDSYTYYDITLTVKVKYDSRQDEIALYENTGHSDRHEDMEMRSMSPALENLGFKQMQDESNGVHEIKLTGLRSLNTALEMLGYNILSKDDEELLTDYIATRGDYGRNNDANHIESYGIINFGANSVSISGIQSGGYDEARIYDKKDDISAKTIKEILAKIRENTPQPE